MQYFHTFFCLQIAVLVFVLVRESSAKNESAVLSAKNESETAVSSAKNESETAVSSAKNESETAVLSCNDWSRPDFVAELYCNVKRDRPSSLWGQRIEVHYRFYTTGGLKLSERWVLGSASKLSAVCKPYLLQDTGCLVNSYDSPIKCEKIIAHPEYVEDLKMFTPEFYDIALIYTNMKMYDAPAIVAWPKTKQFSDSCTTLDVHGQMSTTPTIYSVGETSSQCRSNITVLNQTECAEFQGTHYHPENEPIICARADAFTMKKICDTHFKPGVAVCKNSIVGIYSHTHNVRCNNDRLPLVFTRIADYYTFISETTNGEVQVPFSSSPPSRKDIDQGIQEMEDKKKDEERKKYTSSLDNLSTHQYKTQEHQKEQTSSLDHLSTHQFKTQGHKDKTQRYQDKTQRHQKEQTTSLDNLSMRRQKAHQEQQQHSSAPKCNTPWLLYLFITFVPLLWNFVSE